MRRTCAAGRGDAEVDVTRSLADGYLDGPQDGRRGTGHVVHQVQQAAPSAETAAKTAAGWCAPPAAAGVGLQRANASEQSHQSVPERPAIMSEDQRNRNYSKN